MSHNFSRITFSEQLEKLKETEKWLQGIGIVTSGSRFQEILKIVEAVVEHYNRGRIADLETKYGSQTVWAALLDSLAFIDIHEEFRYLKSHERPISKLRSILEGPLHSWEESPDKNNIQPRNTLFELEVAARLKKSGLQITGFDDVDFIFQHATINVQCKRVHSPKQVKANIDKASEQFRKRMDPEGKIRGIICLAIDKLTGTEDKIIKVNNEGEIGLRLNQVINTFREQYKHTWIGLLNINILAVMIFLRAIIDIKDNPYDLRTSACQVAVCAISDEQYLQFTDKRLIKNLSEKL
ncbi:MAG: hypothetical protein AB1814_02830 [Thermodesulfobacteriota bacterium]